MSVGADVGAARAFAADCRLSPSSISQAPPCPWHLQRVAELIRGQLQRSHMNVLFTQFLPMLVALHSAVPSVPVAACFALK